MKHNLLGEKFKHTGTEISDLQHKLAEMEKISFYRACENAKIVHDLKSKLQQSEATCAEMRKSVRGKYFDDILPGDILYLQCKDHVQKFILITEKQYHDNLRIERDNPVFPVDIDKKITTGLTKREYAAIMIMARTLRFIFTPKSIVEQVDALFAELEKELPPPEAEKRR